MFNLINVTILLLSYTWTPCKSHTKMSLFPPDSSELSTIKGTCERVADVYASIGVLSIHNG